MEVYLIDGNRTIQFTMLISGLENRMRRGCVVYTPKTYEKEEIRRGDWICLICNNHNFSFRKYCNRCENQSRRDNELQATILRRRIDMQINLELEASYNTFPKALFLTLREENSKFDLRVQTKPFPSIPSLTFIDEVENPGEADHSKWVGLILEEDQLPEEEHNKQNIYNWNVVNNTTRAPSSCALGLVQGQ